MNPKARTLKSIVQAARTCDVEMPWARGARRAALIASRTAAKPAARPARTA